MIANQTHRAAAAYLGAFLLFSTAYAAHADVVTDWNQTAIRATEIAGSPPPLQSRVMAMVHAAIFDAVNGIEHKYSPNAVDVSAASGASADAAAAAAAHGVLERLYPPQKAITDAALAASLTRIPEGSARTDGLRLGQEIAAQVFALRKDDGSATQQPYTFSTGGGVYQATPPMNANPVLPHWGNVKPFMMANPKQFAFAGPPDPSSPAFAKDFNEVKRLGSRNSTERTTEETAIAIHWAGSEVPPLNAVARSVAAAKGLTPVEKRATFRTA